MGHVHAQPVSLDFTAWHIAWQKQTAYSEVDDVFYSVRNVYYG